MPPKKRKIIRTVVRPASSRASFKRYTAIVAPPPHRSWVKTKDFTASSSKEVVKHEQSISEWWDSVLKELGDYKCFAFFLMLESDEEVSKYLAKYGRELDIISGDDCLVLLFGDERFQRVGFDAKMWSQAIHEHIAEGYSKRIGEQFDIYSEAFPSLIIFNEINSSEHVIVGLAGLNAKQINQRMRTVFSTISKAIMHNEHPLAALEQQRKRESIRWIGRATISGIKTTGKICFKTIMEKIIPSMLIG